MMFKRFSLIIIISLLLGGYCFVDALTLDKPYNGEKDVPTSDYLIKPGETRPYFVWDKSSVLGIVYYGLHVRQTPDPGDPHEPWVRKYVTTGVCDSLSGKCSLAFISTGGIEYNEEYIWKVIATDAVYASLDSSPEWTFTTKSDPTPPSNGNGGGSFQLENPLKAATLEEALNALLAFLFYLMLIIAPILIIYAAAIMLFAHGDAKQLSKAKQILFWALIALIIAGLARGLPAVIQGMLGG